MKHRSNCRYLRTPVEAEFTMLSISAHEHVKQCNHCGAFERAGSPIVAVDFADLEQRIMGHAEFRDQFLLSPTGTATGRTPKPFNPEPHRLPRRRGLTMALVRVEGGDPHWVDTVKLGLLNFLFLYSVMQQTTEGAVYTPVRFITFDQGSGHANP